MSEAAMQDRYDAAEDAVEREVQRRVPQWQPIETAPRDGTRIALSWWSEAFGEWMYAIDHMPSITHCQATHWMPLPEPPKQKE